MTTFNDAVQSVLRHVVDQNDTVAQLCHQRAVQHCGLPENLSSEEFERLDCANDPRIALYWMHFSATQMAIVHEAALQLNHIGVVEGRV